MDCAAGAEGLDAMEEIRYVFELADDGGLDLGREGISNRVHLDGDGRAFDAIAAESS